MDKDELSTLTVVKLKARLKELGLSTTGKKADLIARILNSEDEEEVLIIDDDDDEPIIVATEFDDDEILEAEVFEAVILDEDEVESLAEETVSSSQKMVSPPAIQGKTWYKDGTTIATILVIILLAGAGG